MRMTRSGGRAAAVGRGVGMAVAMAAERDAVHVTAAGAAPAGPASCADLGQHPQAGQVGAHAMHQPVHQQPCVLEGEGDPAVGLRNVEIHIRIDPQAPLLHVAITHAEVDEQELQFVEPSP